MKEFYCVLVFAALVCIASAEVGAECSNHTDCNQISEFCNRTRTCRWRLASGWFPYFSCEPDGVCELKKGLNDTCRFNQDCQTGHCRWRHCVMCSNDTNCGALQYCDKGFMRVHEPIKQLKKREEKPWWMWWSDGEDEHDDDEGEHYGEPFGRHDREEMEDREDDLEGRGYFQRRGRQNKRNKRFRGKLEGLMDYETGFWMKYIGTIGIHPTWTCQAKMADGNICVRDEQCSSNTCDGGRCVAANARQCTWDRQQHESIGCATNFHCSGGWDPLVTNMCVEMRNCSTDAECPTGRFCDEEHGVCLQCNHHNYTVCGTQSYCYWGMCRPKVASGYCDRWWMCLSGQCMGWNQQCAAVSFFGKKK